MEDSVVVVQLLGTSKVANLKRWLLVRIQNTLWVNKDVVRFDIPVSDPLTVQVCKSLEELVHHLLDGILASLHLHEGQVVCFVRNSDVHSCALLGIGTDGVQPGG